MRDLLIAVVLVGALAGCGSVRTSPTTYARPGMTSRALVADRTACLQRTVGQADV